MVSEHVLSALCGAEILQLLAGEAEPGDETRRVEYLGDSRNVCVLGCAFGSWICFQLVLMWLSFMEFVFFWRHCEDFFLCSFWCWQGVCLECPPLLIIWNSSFSRNDTKISKGCFFFPRFVLPGRSSCKRNAAKIYVEGFLILKVDPWMVRMPPVLEETNGRFFRRCAKRVICESWRFEIWGMLRLVGLIRFWIIYVLYVF